MSVKLPFNEPIPIISVEEAGGHEFGRASFMQVPNCPERLPKPEFSIVHDYKPVPMAVFPPPYIQFKPQCNENLFDAIDYEMDEEDMAWLEARNVTRQEIGLQPVSEEDFELLIDRFEKESFLYMKDTGKLEVPESDDDAICRVCLDGDCEETNLILFCDLCNLPIHQDCYGVPYIPEGQWLCRKCFLSPNEEVYCVMCPNTGGAFKQTDRGYWAHILCALWVPGVRFGNTQFMEPIEGIDNIPPANLKSPCYLCKLKNVGATVNCQGRNCQLSFHASCAQLEGLHLKFLSNGTNVKQEVFCSNHSPLGAPKPKIVKNPEKKFSMPTFPIEKISGIGDLVSFECKGQFVLRLIAYWKLKRIFRSSVPLLKRLQISSAPNGGNENFNKLLAELHQNHYFNSSLKALEKYCSWEREEKSMSQYSCFALTSFDDLVARCSNHLDLSPRSFNHVVRKLNELMDLAKCISNFDTQAKRIQIVDIFIRRVNESKSTFLPLGSINLTHDSKEEEDRKLCTSFKYDTMLQESNSSSDLIHSAGDEHQNNPYLKNPSGTCHTPYLNITYQTPVLGEPSQYISHTNDEFLPEMTNESPNVLPESPHGTSVPMKPHSVPLAVENEDPELYSSPPETMKEVEGMANGSREEPFQGNDQGDKFNTFDIVWAKCQGFPWYPAMIINPEMQGTPSINGLPIPKPPNEVIALGTKQSGPVHLVCYYDRQRSWQWLPVSKIRRFGSEEIDKNMLAFPHPKAKRREVRRAYYKARNHRSILKS